MIDVVPSVPLMDERELAVYLGLTTRCVQKMRQDGSGPKFIRISRRAIRYRLKDIEQWLTDRTRTSTSQNPER